LYHALADGEAEELDHTLLQAHGDLVPPLI